MGAIRSFAQVVSGCIHADEEGLRLAPGAPEQGIPRTRAYVDQHLSKPAGPFPQRPSVEGRLPAAHHEAHHVSIGTSFNASPGSRLLRTGSLAEAGGDGVGVTWEVALYIREREVAQDRLLGLVRQQEAERRV